MTLYAVAPGGQNVEIGSGFFYGIMRSNPGNLLIPDVENLIPSSMPAAVAMVREVSIDAN